MKYYSVESGEVRQKAEEYRKKFRELREGLFKIVESFGCTKACIEDEMMLIRSIQFDGNPPEGWTKKDKDGMSRPKKSKANAEILKHFTPSGGYMVSRRPELDEFFKWLNCPSSYNYRTKYGCGSKPYSEKFRMHYVGVIWFSFYDENIFIYTPDFEAAKRRSEINGEIVERGTFDWKPLDGMKEVCQEEIEIKKLQFKIEQKKKGDV